MTNHPDAHALEIVCGTTGAAGADLSARPLETTPPLSGSTPGALLRTARPRQWLKNGLVFAAPGTAGLLSDPGVVAVAVAAFGVFCMAAAGTYLVNDALGVDADRLHPTKSRRPVARRR